MPKPVKLYWDSCAWLGLINGEADKARELEIVYEHARNGKYELWTSTISMLECRRLRGEENYQRPYTEENEQTIQDLFKQPFVMPIPLSVDIATEARNIWRTTPSIGNTKYHDAIHIASALRWNISIMHTYDHNDLLSLSGKFNCRDGAILRIIYPDETTDGPLFAQNKR